MVLVSPPLVLLLRAREEGLAVVLLRLEDLQGSAPKRRRRALIHPVTVAPMEVVAVALGPVRRHRELTLEVRPGRNLRPIRINPLALLPLPRLLL